MSRLRILDFDIENAPITYRGQDRTTARITAIASCWVDDLSSMHVALLTVDSDPRDLFTEFSRRYAEADMVTGHFIRGHDLPIINGQLVYYGLPTLTEKLSSDTYLDFVRRADISIKQEDLATYLGVPFEKVHMSQADWREANELTPRGVAKTFRRVQGDVLQHMGLRVVACERGLLHSPKVWRP